VSSILFFQSLSTSFSLKAQYFFKFLNILVSFVFYSSSSVCHLIMFRSVFSVYLLFLQFLNLGLICSLSLLVNFIVFNLILSFSQSFVDHSLFRQVSLNF
jgi:hypothetical protein